MAIWYDCNGDLLRVFSTERNLGGEASAETAVVEQRLVDQALEDAGLPIALIADYDDLRQCDIFPNLASEELVDVLERVRLGEAMLLVDHVCYPVIDKRDVVGEFEKTC